MNHDKTLQAILDELVRLAVIRPSRIGPIKTAIKQYAHILGYGDATECLSSAYILADKVRNRLIDERAPQTLGSDGLRNLKNNVSYVVRKAIELEIVSPLAGELASWNGSNPMSLVPKRNENIHPEKYIIDPVPQSLAQKIADYETWSTRLNNRVRPNSLRKRAVTFFDHRQTLLREAGYLVKFKGLNPSFITLSTLIEPSHAIDFVEWRIEQQNRYTAGSAAVLYRILVLAKYLMICAQSSQQRRVIQRSMRELNTYRATLGKPAKVQDKDKRWLSLKQLEMVGRSIYPLNARRVRELTDVTRTAIERHSNNGHTSSRRTFRVYAFRVLQSLLIRLAIRIPLRQRNLREMLWNQSSPEEGKNLYKKDGTWRLRFRGDELKIPEVRGEVHSLAYEFPTDLVDLLEEWLHKWRALLITRQKYESKGKERLENCQEFVFVNYDGRPLSSKQVSWLFKTATYKFTGVAVNPHMIRSIYATEYIKATNNFVDAAFMLGDTVKTVLDSYAKLFDEECGKRANEWISHTLRGE
jgi:hypothetical protein